MGKHTKAESTEIGNTDRDARGRGKATERTVKARTNSEVKLDDVKSRNIAQGKK